MRPRPSWPERASTSHRRREGPASSPTGAYRPPPGGTRRRCAGGRAGPGCSLLALAGRGAGVAVWFGATDQRRAGADQARDRARPWRARWWRWRRQHILEAGLTPKSCVEPSTDIAARARCSTRPPAPARRSTRQQGHPLSCRRAHRRWPCPTWSACPSRRPRRLLQSRNMQADAHAVPNDQPEGTVVAQSPSADPLSRWTRSCGSTSPAGRSRSACPNVVGKSYIGRARRARKASASPCGARTWTRTSRRRPSSTSSPPPNSAAAAGLEGDAQGLEGAARRPRFRTSTDSTRTRRPRR